MRLILFSVAHTAMTEMMSASTLIVASCMATVKGILGPSMKAVHTAFSHTAFIVGEGRELTQHPKQAIQHKSLEGDS